METLLNFDTHLTLLINGSECAWLDHVAWNATHLLWWLPLLAALLSILALRLERRSLCFVLLGIALCVIVSDQVASSIIKPLVCRLRPTHDPALEGLVDIVNGYRGGQYGFFSSHAANTMSVAVYLSLIFRQKLVSTSLVLWSLLTCWTRVYLGVHFFGDVLTGVVFGALVGYCVYVLLRRCVPLTTLSFKPTDSRCAAGIFVCNLIAITLSAL